MSSVNNFHTYCISGFIRHKSFTKTFSTRKLAEDYMCDLIEKHNLQVTENEFVDKHIDEIVCGREARFTIRREN